MGERGGGALEEFLAVCKVMLLLQLTFSLYKNLNKIEKTQYAGQILRISMNLFKGRETS